MSLKVIKFGDERGIGSKIEKSSFFGGKKHYTLCVNDGIDKWVCIEDGSYEYQVLSVFDRFYEAQYRLNNEV